MLSLACYPGIGGAEGEKKRASGMFRRGLAPQKDDRDAVGKEGVGTSHG